MYLNEYPEEKKKKKKDWVLLGCTVGMNCNLPLISLLQVAKIDSLSTNYIKNEEKTTPKTSSIQT